MELGRATVRGGFHGHNRTTCTSHYLSCDATDNDTGEAGSPLRSHHNQICLALFGTLDRDLGWIALQCQMPLVGLLAAKAAQMHAIVIPGYFVAGDPRFVIADHQLSSLAELNEKVLQSF